MKPVLVAAGAATLAAAVVAGTWLALGTDDADPSGAAATPIGMVTTFPDLPAPTGEPELPGIRSIAPEPGSVGRIPGPFDSRFVTHELAFDGTEVTGSLEVTSDVSELLDLQVLAGFYDTSGAYLGEGRWTYHLDEAHHEEQGGHPDEHATFRVAVPDRFAGKAASAAIGVPVLVNE